MEIFGWLCSCLFMICYVPQIMRTYQRKEVGDVSLIMWLVQWVAYTCGILYSFYIQAVPLLFGYSIGWLMTAWWLELYRQFNGRAKWVDPKDIDVEALVRGHIKRIG